MGPLLRDHRIPLVFLDACQTALAEQASESVASELLKVGVASVAAMSHSVLVATATRFVAAFYGALAVGRRVGDAMLEGQRQLQENPFRGRVFGAGELRLEDWFVPVLYQEKEDPQLFRSAPAKQTVADFNTALEKRLGALPEEPETGFVGRSRDLLALQRLLGPAGGARYAVLRGQGGEGKTALAAEYARWMVRSQQARRAAFVSVETHSHAAAVLDALGHQIVGPDYTVAAFDSLEQALPPVERALAEQETLLVVDNMESVLLPPYLADDAPPALSEELRHEAGAILDLCARLGAAGETRLLFTSREALPAPFDGERERRELARLEREDAVKLVERALHAAGASSDAAREEIEQLVDALAVELVQTGLATRDPYNHLTLVPTLCPYLRGRMDAAEREALVARWVEAMLAYVGFLHGQEFEKAEVAATLTMLELPNLLALLERVRGAGDAEATIDLATSLYSLLQGLGKPRLLERVGRARDAAAAALGEGAYPEADYDLAVACLLLARVLQTAGGSEQALPLLDEARGRFEGIAQERASQSAEGMASLCFTERGDCLFDLGRLDDAAAAYEEGIRRSEQRGADRDVAVGKGQLGTVRLRQRRYEEALAAYEEARERFAQLGEPGTVAVFWHQTGMVHQDAGRPEAAEEAYRRSLAIKVRLGNVAGQASTLGQLGNLYSAVLGRPEEAAAFYRQAADRYVEIGDRANEGVTRSNLGDTLRKLRRLDEARREIRRAIECKAPFGHAAEPWKTWGILTDIETDAGDPAAAAEARAKALACFLAYRRDGGENHSGSGRLALAVTQALRGGNRGAAASLLQQQASRYDTSGFGGFIRALQAVVAGSRDRALAAAPDLSFDMAAEILLLIEALEQGG